MNSYCNVSNKNYILDLFDYDRGMKYPKIRAWLKRIRENCNPHFDLAHKYVSKILFGNISNSKI